jgi:YfiH family protein
MNPGWAIEPSPLGRILIAPELPEGIALFYTGSDFDGALTPESVQRIRHTLRDRFSVDARFASCGQVHGVRVERVSASQNWSEFSGCDALFTTGKNVALGIKVADCLPVTLVDPTHSVMANAHSGWRGTAAGITSTTLRRLLEESSFETASARAWLGPSIRSCCMQVGEEVIEAFRANFDHIESHVDRSRGPRPFLNIVDATISVLKRAGFGEEQIFDSGICTRCGEGFHSYRRDQKLAGRNLAIVAR